MKLLLLLRHASGAGSSTFAENLKILIDKDIYTLHDDKCIILSADQFFEKNGEYKWEQKLLGAAHLDCLERTDHEMECNRQLIIITNTFTKESELKPYYELATKYDYQVTSLVVENRHGGKDIHNVPTETLEKQEQRLKNSLKLR